jgi:RNA recognition motif-containing protein
MNKALFIRNIPSSWVQINVCDYFSKFAEVDNFHFQINKRTMEKQNCGLLYFSNEESVKILLSEDEEEKVFSILSLLLCFYLLKILEDSKIIVSKGERNCCLRITIINNIISDSELLENLMFY